jgi:hypothetical protein
MNRTYTLQWPDLCYNMTSLRNASLVGRVLRRSWYRGHVMFSSRVGILWVLNNSATAVREGDRINDAGFADRRAELPGRDFTGGLVG